MSNQSTGTNKTSSYPASYYAASRNEAPERPRLEGDHQTQVCVIGAGFSGIATGLSLAEKGYSVTVLEAKQVGFGASGRNGGQIVNSYSRDIDAISKRYGEDAGKLLGDMAFEGGDIIRERVDKYAIHCGLTQGGVFAAFTGKQLKELEERKRLWARYGNDDTEILDANSIRKHTNTDIYVGGLYDNRGGNLHPLNLVLGEAAALESLGGTIHEFSRVTRLEKGAKAKIYTEHGSVTADTVVVCGNAYLEAEIKQVSARVIPVNTQVMATEPLGEDVAKRLMPSGACVEDCNYFLDYYRMSEDYRLLFGGGSVYSGKSPEDIEQELRPHLARTFPELKDVKIDYVWSGNFAMTFSRIPDLGKLDDNIYYTHGYSGHGVSTTHLVGRLMSEAIDGHSERFNAFAGLRNIPFPGGRRFRVPMLVLGSWYYVMREKLGM